MRFALDRYGSRGHFLFEMAFYLHKEFRAAGIRFLSTQRIGGRDLEENGHFLQGKRVARWTDVDSFISYLKINHLSIFK